MANVRGAVTLAATLCLLSLLGSCVVYPKIDTRPMEQQLADRAPTKFSFEAAATFNSADRSKPLQLKLRDLFPGCAPLEPPIRAMLREKANRVDWVISAVILPSGLFDSVKAVNVIPETMTADAEATFALALKTPPCRLATLASPLNVEIPFRFQLD